MRTGMRNIVGSLLLSAISAHAETVMYITAGISGSGIYDIPKAWTPEDEDDQGRAGFFLGVTTLTPTLVNNGRWHFRSGLLYVQKGDNWDLGDGKITEIRSDYLHVPLLLQKTWRDQGIRPNIVAGLSSGYMISENLSKDADLTRFELGTTFGGGIRTDKILVDIHVDISRTPFVDLVLWEAKNVVINWAISYKIK